MSATRATRTSSSISLLIYLYRNSFLLHLQSLPFFSLVSSCVYRFHAAGFFWYASWVELSGREREWETEWESWGSVEVWVKDDINIIAISFIFAGFRCRLKFRWQRLGSLSPAAASPPLKPHSLFLSACCLLNPSIVAEDKSGGQFVFHFAVASLFVCFCLVFYIA